MKYYIFDCNDCIVGNHSGYSKYSIAQGQAIITKYHGPTNTKCSRISAKCAAGSVYMSYKHGLDVEENHIAAAEMLREKLGWNSDFYGALATGCIYTGEYVHVMIGK